MCLFGTFMVFCACLVKFSVSQQNSPIRIERLQNEMHYLMFPLPACRGCSFQHANYVKCKFAWNIHRWLGTLFLSCFYWQKIIQSLLGHVNSCAGHRPKRPQIGPFSPFFACFGPENDSSSHRKPVIIPKKLINVSKHCGLWNFAFICLFRGNYNRGMTWKFSR